jgi:Fe(II)/alpha-ketoglutarate-dependent arginine beta-hydroxylase
MFRLALDDEQLTGIADVVGELAARFGSVESPDFLETVGTYAHELPRPLRCAMATFRLTEPDGVCLVSGFPVDNAAIGPTPEHWNRAKGSPATLSLEIYFCLLASLLGDPIAWATQQSGYVMHDIMPIREHKFEQLGSGSEETLTWHTEDAFHPLRTDYLALMCLRNPDGVRTTLASIDDLDLDEDLVAVLRQERFPIRPDRSHLPEHRSLAGQDPATERLLARSYEWVRRLDENPDRVAVLFGAEDSPYIRLDPYFMALPADDPEAAAALSTLTGRIDEVIGGHSLRPGDVIFLDNYRVVHGRQPFTARFDGTDRWLKRLNLARDLRKSRAMRTTARSRVIY